MDAGIRGSVHGYRAALCVAVASAIVALGAVAATTTATAVPRPKMTAEASTAPTGPVVTASAYRPNGKAPAAPHPGVLLLVGGVLLLLNVAPRTAAALKARRARRVTQAAALRPIAYVANGHKRSIPAGHGRGLGVATR